MFRQARLKLADLIERGVSLVWLAEHLDLSYNRLRQLMLSPRSWDSYLPTMADRVLAIDSEAALRECRLRQPNVPERWDEARRELATKARQVAMAEEVTATPLPIPTRTMVVGNLGAIAPPEPLRALAPAIPATQRVPRGTPPVSVLDLLARAGEGLQAIFGDYLDVAFRTQTDEELAVLLKMDVGVVETYRREYGMPVTRCKRCRDRLIAHDRTSTCDECAFYQHDALIRRLEAGKRGVTLGACRECGGALGLRREVCQACAYGDFLVGSARMRERLTP